MSKKKENRDSLNDLKLDSNEKHVALSPTKEKQMRTGITLLIFQEQFCIPKPKENADINREIRAPLSTALKKKESRRGKKRKNREDREGFCVNDAARSFSFSPPLNLEL